jgi:hypothetical protein
MTLADIGEATRFGPGAAGMEWPISSHGAHPIAKSDQIYVHYLSIRIFLRNTLLARCVRRFGFKSRRSEFAYRTFNVRNESKRVHGK